jgi:CRISPR/Cas system CMR-associated protein Cmr3 (group 5 of RAMP superfamily)
MTDSLYFQLSAIDTLMFRDGRPFNQGDTGASEAVSIFPPLPPTIIGAIRAALWKHKGGPWPSNGSLGNGTNWQDDENVLGVAYKLVLYRTLYWRY